MGIALGSNRYGKAEVRLVHVDRSTPAHVLTDLTVTGHLTGDFSATHRTGANDAVIATDTQKNAVYALARSGGVGPIEEFGLRLGRHFTGYPQVEGARYEIEQAAWDRIVTTAGGPHDHAFTRPGGEVRTAVITRVGEEEHALAGLRDLVVLKSTDSEFWGFPRVEYTALAETTDRILATAVSARWRYLGSAVDWDTSYAGIRRLLLDRFAETYSYSLQQTLHAMGTGVLEAHPEVAEIRFSMPNRHHVLVDLAPWGLDNPNEVWFAADRPYGLIEATVLRDDVPPAPAAWADVAGFV